MTTTYQHRPEIELDVTRCYTCGRFWAIERGVTGQCPCCAERKREAQSDIITKQDATIRGLRGALGRLKKRRG